MLCLWTVYLCIKCFCLWTVYLLNILSTNCLSIKCCVYELSSLWIVFSMNYRVYEMLAYEIYYIYYNCHVYEFSIYSMFVYELSCRWNVWKPVESMIKYLNWNNDVFISPKRISLLFHFKQRYKHTI